MDYNLVASEEMVAYMHLDKAIVNHLKQEWKQQSFVVISTYQVLLVVVDHQWVELMVVELVHTVEHYLVDMVKHYLVDFVNQCLVDMLVLLKTKE
jgi:hypothetical protein